MLFPENAGTKDFAHEKHTKAPEGATTGATSGAVIGGTLGWLVGIGAVAIPGLGPFVAAGPVIAALAGVGAGGAVGGIAGALIGIGIPEYEAREMKAASKAAAFCSQSIAIIAIGPNTRTAFSRTPARRISPPPARLKPISPRAINRCPGRALRAARARST